jgi:hypothetical protein
MPHYRVNLGWKQGFERRLSGVRDFRQTVDPFAKMFGKTRDTHQDGKSQAQIHVGAFYAALAPGHLINTMFARIAPDWYPYHKTIYKMVPDLLQISMR